VTDRTPDTDEVDRLVALVRARYGDRLTDTEVAEVRAGVEAVVRNARALRTVPLDNADGPMPPFVPFRADTPAGSPPDR
jgi:hypothetical protein